MLLARSHQLRICRQNILTSFKVVSFCPIGIEISKIFYLFDKKGFQTTPGPFFKNHAWLMPCGGGGRDWKKVPFKLFVVVVVVGGGGGGGGKLISG